ncbi:MAG TPA: tRNA dihydrouridine synthase DusB [Gaiellales bacterium]|nr:tRNA dihydrouridine synthase DusB [Gaiellales bacterium]
MPGLSSSWRIRDIEIPSRIVLAPMAGVSVQAFRRQGRRFGAGLVCSEMVSSCGLSYGNERTLGYLRIARDEHPLAVQIFGSEPERMAEAAEMVVEAGADIVDINFGCPVRKVTKTGAGASALEDHDLACRLAGAVVDAVEVPVTVKMRRGVRNGSRTALELGPKLEAVGVAALTLHPRSAQQMYTGTADHALTAELVDSVSVPVMASGDITDGPAAERVLAETGAAAVMIGRGAQGRPWALREMAQGGGQQPSRAEVVAELVRFMREVVREMGEERSVGFLRKFYGWYLRGLDGAKELRVELTQAPSVELAEAVLLDACPQALPLLAEAEAEMAALPDTDSDRTLDLPISIYGGG